LSITGIFAACGLLKLVIRCEKKQNLLVL